MLSMEKCIGQCQVWKQITFETEILVHLLPLRSLWKLHSYSTVYNPFCTVQEELWQYFHHVRYCMLIDVYDMEADILD